MLLLFIWHKNNLAETKSKYPLPGGMSALEEASLGSEVEISISFSKNWFDIYPFLPG